MDVEYERLGRGQRSPGVAKMGKKGMKGVGDRGGGVCWARGSKVKVEEKHDEGFTAAVMPDGLRNFGVSELVEESYLNEAG